MNTAEQKQLLEAKTRMAEVYQTAMLPAYSLLKITRTKASDVLMLAIGLQESRLLYRQQLGNGPAMGLWQFERGGGVKGVLQHPVTSVRAMNLCANREVQPIQAAVHERLKHDDVLAAGFARLLLLSDPRPLPNIEDEQGAWDYYLRNWRPGQPHPQTWPAFHAAALEFVEGLE